MKVALEQYLVDVIEDRRCGFTTYPVRSVMRVASWVYGSVSRWRNWAFEKKLFKQYVAPVPVVVSIGNLVAGGTGKTPLTALFAKSLGSEFQLSVLLRGYRSPAEHLAAPIVLSEGNGALYPAGYAGDESVLLAKKLKGVSIFVGKDRRKSSQLAVRRGSQVLLLDDGMQYRQLHRDFEIVLVDGTDPFGKEYFLPRGYLREGLEGLARADLVVVNHTYDRGRFLTAKHRIAKYSDAAVVAAKPVFSHVTLGESTFTSIEGKRVGLFCGIAKPAHFRRLVRSEGAEILGECFSRDHELPFYEDVKAFAAKCKKQGAEWLLCTEKDAVKIPDAWDLPLPVATLAMELEIVEGKEHWNAMMENIRAKVLRDMALAGS